MLMKSVIYLSKSVNLDVPGRNSFEFKSIQRFVRISLLCDQSENFNGFFQVSLFCSFATSGNPNDDVVKADFGDIIWQPVNSPSFKCLNISEYLTFDEMPESERLILWNEIYLQT
jgi:hypothetical protein